MNQPHAKLCLCANSLLKKIQINKPIIDERGKKIKGDVTHDVWVYKTHTAVEDIVGMMYSHQSMYIFCPQAIQLYTSRSDHA